ncbi:calx-beta domain protein [Arenibacter algicola]|uniref:Calx-beta domain protein n=2 Tax=Arenibacter algicola TaxID=616991 RepID=A0A221V306_9FLAO|nr:calx-beta domain protein [Arenibacter algicola]
MFVAFCNFAVSNAQNTSVYVSAHPDDWQLFMNPNAYNSVKGANEKVIFLHTTAGDAGNSTGSNGYYLAREEGSLRAIRFMSNAFTSGSGLGTNMNETVVTINGHQITKFTYRNAVAYFLRLPDGSPSGNGYTLHNNNSLRKFYDGITSSISAIDGSTTYNSISDLRTTIQNIIEMEAGPSDNIIMNSADHDTSINPDDHSDHIYSSKIIQDVGNIIGGVTTNLYIDYYTSLKAQNVFGDAFLINAGTWGATASGITDKFHYGTWDPEHNVWLDKQYFRTISSSSNPNITITATDDSASESPLDNGSFTVSLPSVNTGAAITVNYTVSGTAIQGSDYTALSGSVSIPNGAQSANITVAPINDTEVEPSETVIVTLATGTGYNIGSPSSATVNITSEDTSPFDVSIAASDASASESPLDNGTLTVSLSSVNTGTAITVNYTVGGSATQGSDYTALSGSVNIPNGAQSATITVVPVNDTAVEPVETVIVTLASGTGYTVGSPSSATVNITSEDTSPSGTNIALNKTTSSSSYESGHSSSYAVDNNYALTSWWGASPFPQWWQVDLGADYDLNKVVVVNYYDGSRYYQYDIQYSSDGSTWSTLIDNNSNTVPATSQGSSYSINNTRARYLRVNMNYNSANVGVHIVEFEAYGTLSYNANPNVSITANDASASESPLDNGSFTVSLPSVNTGAAITVNYTVSGTAIQGSDYTALSGSVSIPNGAQSANITVAPINDTEVEPSETVIVTLATGTGYNIGSPSSATVNITSEDTSPFDVSIAASDASASESPLDNGTLTVSLSSVNTGTAITVNYTVGGSATQGSDYTALSGSVNIPNGAQSATITVVPVNDTAVEPVETVIVTLASGTGYTVGSPSSATVNITSEDTSPSGTNIALNKTTSSSSYESGHSSSYAVDNNYALTSWWGASPFPQWWQVDLGADYDLNKVVVVNYYDGSRYYQYDIQYSSDGSTWSTLIDNNSNTVPATSQGSSYSINNTRARYLRVNMNYNSANVGVHIVEFEAYGTLTSNSLSSKNSLNLTSVASAVKATTATTGTTEDLPVAINPENYSLSIYPNPVLKGDQINLKVDLPIENNALIEVFTLDGRIIHNKEYSFNAGTNEIEIPSNQISSGVLVVKANVQGEVINKKLIVQ